MHVTGKVLLLGWEGRRYQRSLLRVFGRGMLCVAQLHLADPAGQHLQGGQQRLNSAYLQNVHFGSTAMGTLQWREQYAQAK